MDSLIRYVKEMQIEIEVQNGVGHTWAEELQAFAQMCCLGIHVGDAR